MLFGSNLPPMNIIDTSAINSISHIDLKIDGLEDFEGQIGRADFKDNLKGRSTREASVRRRRAQNRASQRAYRERRDRHIEELEQKNRFLERQASELLRENERLKMQVLQLQNAQNISLTVSAANSSSSLPCCVSQTPSTFCTSTRLDPEQADRASPDAGDSSDLIEIEGVQECSYVKIEQVYQEFEGEG